MKPVRYPLVKTVDKEPVRVFLKILEVREGGYIRVGVYHQSPYKSPLLVKTELISTRCHMDKPPLRQIPEPKLSHLSVLLTYS